MIIREIVLKVTSTCNLSCKYCYVFNQGDTSFLHEPKVMNEDVIISVLQKVNNYCELHKLNNFFIVFHGGEPLIVGHEFYEKFISLSNKIIKSVKIHYTLQTNGTLLSEKWCNFFNEFNITVGVSMDGNKLSSVNRVFKNNNMEAYDKILEGYNTAKQFIQYLPILSVINTSANVSEHYQFFKKLKVPHMDCLFPDSTYEKFDKNAKHLGRWLVNLFDLWYFDKDENKPIIRIFYIIIRLLLGNEAGCELLGTAHNGVINIKSNGNIESVDSLKICGDGFARTKYNILRDELDSIKESDVFYKYYNSHQDDVLCEKCKKCIIKEICGGGLLAHRFSKANGFNNPSVYCKDLFLLISHIQNTLIDDLPEELTDKIQIQKLLNDDYN
ncbi:MAG: radical SAM protein [Lactobacillaceae bacterium]|jgi:uncharacterized protein|nr:radical SAM protein [Lactobacillaceae bacterium]